MILNNIEVEVLASIELIDACNKKFPEKCPNKNVIYCVHNKINGKNYIGQTTNFRNRFSMKIIGHFKCYNDYINGNPIRGKYLYRAWNKYEFKSFIVYIIDEGSDRADLNVKETYWIKTLHTCVKDPECFGYNLTWGADDLGHLFTPESIAKGRQTKIERYGTTDPFINSHTPEAKEKRRQTLIDRYGTTSVVTKESLEKMMKTNLEKYGSIVGNLINREKAGRNRKINDFFEKVNVVKNNNEDFTLESYFNYLVNFYSELKRVTYHFDKIIEMFSDLKADDRWTSDLDIVFGNSSNEIKERYLELYKKKRDQNIEKFRTKDWGNQTSAIQTLKSINNILNEFPITSWEEYKLAVYEKCGKRYRYKVKPRLKKLIEILPVMKTLKDWTLNHERIFGQLTEKDIENL